MSVIRDVRTAVGFLTRIPVGSIEPFDSSLRRSGGYFPLVGAVVGGVGVAVWWVGANAVGQLAAAVLSVLATVIVTGAFHEDGLADTVDGLWGGATPERRLDIMRDSRLGTYGSIAIVGDVLLRVAIVAPLAADDIVSVAKILVAGHVVARAAPLALVATTPHARADGQGSHLIPPTRAGWAVAAVTVLGTTMWAAGPWFPVLMAAATAVTLAIRRAGVRRIGGVTGDVLGASVALSNLAVAATTAALISRELI